MTTSSSDLWLEDAPYSATQILVKLQERGFQGKYSIVKEYVRGKKKDLDEKATVRFETMPGLQAQVDSAYMPQYIPLLNQIDSDDEIPIFTVVKNQ